MTAPLAVLPPAVTALREVIRAALPEVTAEEPAGIEVFDGPDASRSLAARSVTVAAAFEEDQDAIASDRLYTGAGSNYTETTSVACSAYVGGGDDDLEAWRAEMGGILQAIAEAIDADPTLGDRVARARLTSATWLQGINDDGAGVMVGFVVELTVLS